MTVERVLVGVDGAGSIAALRAAMDLVAPTGELRLVRVVEVSLVRRALELVLSGGAEAARAQRRAKAEDGLVKLAAVIRAQASARVESTVMEGGVADALVQASAGHGAELVVVGDRRPRGLRRHFVGGVVKRLVERSAVPVLVVPELALLHRVNAALWLAPAPPGEEVQREVQRVLGAVRPSVEFLATGLRPHRGLNHDLEMTTTRTVVVVSRRTALHDLGTCWLLDHVPGPVLFVPSGDDADAERDRLGAYAAWHGDVPGGRPIDLAGGRASTPAVRATGEVSGGGRTT